MNLQVIADPRGDTLWVSGALPGSVHDKKAEWMRGVLAELEDAGELRAPLNADSRSTDAVSRLTAEWRILMSCCMLSSWYQLVQYCRDRWYLTPAHGRSFMHAEMTAA
jgi:hypothetical protein